MRSVVTCCLLGVFLSPVLSVPVGRKAQPQQRHIKTTANDDPLPAISLTSQDATGLRQFVDAHGRIRVFHGVNAV
eukprot:744008-Rhodomonas_salina.1